MTYDIKNRPYNGDNWPRWATIEVRYDQCWSMDDYDDECLSDEFRDKVNREQVWAVGIIVKDIHTGDADSLWGITTEDMYEGTGADLYDLDECGQEVALDLLQGLARTRVERLTREAARFANLAAEEVAS